MTHNLSFRYYANMTTKGLVLWSAKVELLRGGNVSTRGKALTCCKSLTNFIT